MSMTSEFKEFAVKGNVIDLAVGVIIGAAFGKIVDSMVDDSDHADRRGDRSASSTSRASIWCWARSRPALPTMLAD